MTKFQAKVQAVVVSYYKRIDNVSTPNKHLNGSCQSAPYPAILETIVSFFLIYLQIKKINEICYFKIFTVIEPARGRVLSDCTSFVGL